MSRVHDVEVFVQVVETGGFTAAARKIGITKSYASKLVARLESRLGVRLLQRNTRRLALTPEGRRFHARALEALEALAAAEEEAAVGAGHARGRLRLTVPNAFGLQHLSEPLLALRRNHPELVLEVAYADRVVDLVGEGYDLAIRAGVLVDSSLVARKLASARQALFASPAYLAEHGAPETPDDLTRHAALRYAYEANPGAWALQGAGGDVAQVRVDGPLVANNAILLVAAAAAGMGIAYLPEFHVVEEVRRGDLVHVMPGWGRKLGLFAVFPHGRNLPAKVRVAVDHLVEHFRRPVWAGLLD